MNARPLLRPPALVKGDTIGVVAPSYLPKTGWLLRGVHALERAGYSVVLDPEIAKLRRFARAEDERRAENFMGMWLDPRIKALIGGTGGYGAVRMLPYLEPEIFRLNLGIFELKYSMNFFMNLLHNFSKAVVLGVGGWYVINGQTEVGIVVAFISGLDNINDPWGDLVNWFQDMMVNNARYEIYVDAMRRFQRLATVA